MKIEWSELAREDIANTISFLESKFGLLTATKFLDRIDLSIEIILSNPTTFLRVDKHKNVYKFVISKHVSLYYQIKNETIYLVTFWQNRREGLDKIFK